MSEHQLQIAVSQMLKLFATPGVIYYHVPNGGLRNKREAAKLKAYGLRAGVPDFAFVLPPLGQSAYLELKAPKGRLSPEQKTFRDEAIAAGAKWNCADSPELACDILYSWGVFSQDPLGRQMERVLGLARAA